MTVVLPYTLRNDRRITGFTDVLDGNGETVAYLVPMEDARLIVQAVNDREELLLRLARLLVASGQAA